MAKCRLSFFAKKVPKIANICLIKVNNRNTRKACEICSKLTIKIPKPRQGPNYASDQFPQRLLVRNLMDM